MKGMHMSSHLPDPTPGDVVSVGGTPVTPVRKQRILIAEDNATTRQQLQQLLENSLGVAVDTAGDGSEALEALTERPYSIVITDLRMPKVNGMELIEEIQQRAAAGRPSSSRPATAASTRPSRPCGWGPTTS